MSRYRDVLEIVLNLLAHNLMDVREETYRLCQKTVVTNIGPKLNMNSVNPAGSQVLFLLTSRILVEVCAFGMTSENLEIRRYAEDILTYVLKCKLLVSDSVYSRVVEALIPALPIVLSHVTRTSPLGKTLVMLTDPDTAANSSIPSIAMLKCNVQLLFSNDAYLRDEAFSRICWLLASQEKSREMLPKFNTLYDTALANVCRLKRVVDINKVRYTEHFYQPSSLHQVMDLLKSQNVEPVLRRSALNQVSVMVEDPLLHQTFLDSNGIELVTGIMKTALTEQDYRDYPDSVVPIVSILKNLCLYHSNVREQLSINAEVFYCILRGLFLFFTEERMRQDATALLFLLIFNNFIKGNPSSASFSLPVVVCEKMHLPFQCNSHWKVSEYSKENIKDTIVSDRWCLSSVQIQWNSEIFGGFNELVTWDEINYDEHSMFNFVDDLKLNNNDLRAIKCSSISYCMKQYLNAVQNGTSHNSVMDSIDCLTVYIYLYKISRKFNKNDDESLLSLPWQPSFSRFIRSLPSCEDDVLLLKNVIKFFTILVPFYKSSGKDCWIVTVLKDGSQCILDLLTVDSTTDEENKVIGQELLRLVTACVDQEQHYLDYYPPSVENDSKSWTHIIKIIADNMKFSDAQHFYNLAYLDALLSCLVHLTATLGWSGSKPNSTPREPVPQMISGLCELVGAFHCGKGPSAAVSVMGLSITRHVLLILNHLLAELQNSKAKGWEAYFFEDVDTGNLLRSFLALWASRDVVLRAAALQLFAGLVVSPRAAIEIVNEVKIDSGNIWELAFTVIVDHTEASIVRENAAQLLANLAGHVAPLSGDKASVLPALKKDCARQLLNLFEEYDFYSHLDIILSALFTTNVPDTIRRGCQLEESKRALYRGLLDSDKSWSSSSDTSEKTNVATTPGFVKSVCAFLYNMVNLSPDDVANKLLERGLVKLLFRTICDPSMEVATTKELSLYCDIIEMDTVTCCLLTRLANCSASCLGTILHTKDCLSALLSLLNYKIYQRHVMYRKYSYLM
ncbi:hypothetical protein NQ318_009229 [Aromia moschata]|uniref:ARM repeat superfamily protein n=1 Tax=Aromia moschata TaxID=1265417 RepID=A0AAV8YCC3_9CUCU|nr:hypothetical protein NQ318_009229 [Aromia moschata]